MSLLAEDRYPIVDILEQTPAIPASCQWALFLRNHDELTLEMVSDEERDSMKNNSTPTISDNYWEFSSWTFFSAKHHDNKY